MASATSCLAPGLFLGKVVLITGAGGGVGSATARALTQLGAALALTDANEAALEATAAGLAADTAAAGGAASADHAPLLVVADIREVAECARVVAAAVARFGRLDGLVNCAGVWVQGDSADAIEADWARCIDVNLKGTFFMCSRAIPALKEAHGAIVNISSDAGVVGNQGAAIYCASKGGVTVMSKSLAVELAPFGVRVNALCPSDIRTPMLQGQADRYGAGDPAGYLRALLSHYPQGPERARFIEPAEVAQYVAFLLSPAGAAVTGASVMLDFGVTAGY